MNPIKKNVFLILFIIFTSTLYARNTCYLNCWLDTPRLVHFNQDTSQYLIKDFNDSASLYINQPLNKLLKKLEITPQFFIGLGGLKEKDSIRLVKIYFADWDYYNAVMSTRTQNNVYHLDITFDQPFATKDFDLMQKNAQLRWSRVVKIFLGSKIIKQFKFYKK